MKKFVTAFLILGLLATISTRVALAGQGPQDQVSQDRASSYAGGNG